MSDLATDSQPEENQAIDENQMILGLESVNVSGVVNDSFTQSDKSHNDFDYDEFTKYNDWFPFELRKKLNIAIIHADEDITEARDMKVCLEKNVHLVIGGKRFRPRVELLEAVTPSNKEDPVDYALREADFLFVYVTRHFNDGGWCKHQSKSSLRDILSADSTHCSLFCVRTDASKGIKLDATLNNVKFLDYYEHQQEQFVKDVIEQFSKVTDILLSKQHELTEIRKQYVHENPHIFRRYFQSVNQESKRMVPSSQNRNELPHQNQLLTTEVGKILLKNQASQHLPSAKHRTMRQQTSPLTDVIADSGVFEDDDSRKAINPQPNNR